MSTIQPITKPIGVRLRPVEQRLIMIVGDLLGGYLALLAALYFWAQRDQWFHFTWDFLRQRPPLWYWFLPVLWILLINELYDIHRASNWREILRGILIGAAAGAGFYLLVFFLSEPDSLPRQGVASFILFTVVLTFLWRLVYIKVFSHPQFMRRVLVVGAGKAGG